MSKYVRERVLLNRISPVLGNPKTWKVTGTVAAALVLTYSLKHYGPQFERLVRKLGAKLNRQNITSELVVTRQNGSHISNDKKSSSLHSKNPTVNMEFLKQLMEMIRIMVPSWWCNESGLLFLHTATLLARTYLSIYVAHLEGRVVKYIVRKDVVRFITILCQWVLVAIPATFINSMIRFMECQIALAFRTRLVRHSYKLYFENDTYYRIGNLDRRIENADHCLTEDISDFTNSVARLYSHLTKPVVDMVIITVAMYKINSRIGTKARLPPLMIGVVITITASILRLVSPRFGRLVAEEAQKKAYLRHLHSRIIANAEEIAFYAGHKAELVYVQKAYDAVISQTYLIFNKKLWYVMLEQFFMKYVWSATGMLVVAIPLLTEEKSGELSAQFSASSDGDVEAFQSDGGVSHRTQYFSTVKNLLLSGGDATERLMSSYKEIVALAGYTSRVANMFRVFKEVGASCYHRDNGVVATNGHSPVDLIYRMGTVIETAGTVALKDVPIVTPNGDVIVSSVNFTIAPGSHLLISGPNGCGKSSLFRILCGLWPLRGGVIYKPPSGQMFYIPQRPYLSLGSLREQIIYPDTEEMCAEKGIVDDDLEEILDIVNLGYIVHREGGWDVVADWKDILSGGEKQRVGMARLFYHRPKYALLDECTSAVSIDAESKIYQAIIDAGIVLLTITHRPSLWKFHTHLLQFDGAGGWCYEPLDTDSRLTLKEEKQCLEAQLSGMPKAQARLRELCTLLGEDSVVLCSESNMLKETSVCNPIKEILD